MSKKKKKKPVRKVTSRPQVQRPPDEVAVSPEEGRAFMESYLDNADTETEIFDDVKEVDMSNVYRTLDDFEPKSISKYMLSLDKSLHQCCKKMAKAHNLTFNSFVVDALERRLRGLADPSTD